MDEDNLEFWRRVRNIYKGEVVTDDDDDDDG